MERLVFLTFEIFFQRTVFAEVDVVDHPSGFALDQADRVCRGVRVGARFWKCKSRGDGRAIAFLKGGFDDYGFVQISAARLARFVDGLKGKSVSEVWFLVRVLLQIGGFTP